MHSYDIHRGGLHTRRSYRRLCSQYYTLHTRHPHTTRINLVFASGTCMEVRHGSPAVGVAELACPRSWTRVHASPLPSASASFACTSSSLSVNSSHFLRSC